MSNWRIRKGSIQMRACVIAFALLAAQGAQADICDFRPSLVAGKLGQKTKGVASDVASAATERVRALGVYTLENPVTGVTMLSSGASSAAAAATGLASGTNAALGTAATIATAPATIAVAGATVIALGGFEGTCYLRSGRITDDAIMLEIVSNIAENSDPTQFLLIPKGSDYITLKGKSELAEEPKLRIAAAGLGPFIFDVADLYIADGILKHSDALRDTVIGKVALEVVEVVQR